MRKIDKNIPIPTESTIEVMGLSSDLSRLQIGDSMKFTFQEGKSLRQLASKLAREDKKKFTIRIVDGGYRAWRLE